MDAMPDNDKTIGAVLAAQAAARPDALYVHAIDDGRELTYGQLWRLGNRIAQALAARGIGANDRVLMLSENTIEFMAIFLGVIRAGATIATANVEMNRAHLAEIVRAVSPKLILCQDGLGLEELCEGTEATLLPVGMWHEGGGATGFCKTLEEFDPENDVPPVCSPGDIAVIFYTSGTEAKPKGVTCPHV
jgi:acyl-CoA synthetase (AMP-forming)/AMP-acid ligase II